MIEEQVAGARPRENVYLTLKVGKAGVSSSAERRQAVHVRRRGRPSTSQGPVVPTRSAMQTAIQSRLRGLGGEWAKNFQVSSVSVALAGRGRPSLVTCMFNSAEQRKAFVDSEANPMAAAQKRRTL